MTTIIQPTLSLEANLNSTVISVWPEDAVDIINNSLVLLDLSLLTYNTSLKPIKVIVEWGDNTTDTYKYSFKKDSITWLSDIQEWIQNIGPHRYSLPNNKIGNNLIRVIVYDCDGNEFIFDIKIKILSESLANLGINFSIENAVYNGELASVIFNINKDNKNSPIISILD